MIIEVDHIAFRGSVPVLGANTPTRIETARAKDGWLISIDTGAADAVLLTPVDPATGAPRGVVVEVPRSNVLAYTRAAPQADQQPAAKQKQR